MDKAARPERPLQREDRRSESPARAGARSAGDDEQLTRELQLFEHLSPAQRLERIAEHEIMTLLQLQRFDPSTPEWITVARALVEYGYAVFCAWFATGVARSMAANHAGGRGVIGLSKIPEGLRLDDDDAHALSLELMMASVNSFRTRTLMNPKRTWRPDGGASLKTYFIGRCLMELPDTYRRWRRAEGPAAADVPDVPDDGRMSDDPADHAIATARLREVDPVSRAMFELQDHGYSLTEIAEILTTAGYPNTEGSVRTRMSRVRLAARAS